MKRPWDWNSSKQFSSVWPILPGDLRPLMPVSKLSLVLIIQVIATDEAWLAKMVWVFLRNVKIAENVFRCWRELKNFSKAAILDSHVICWLVTKTLRWVTVPDWRIQWPSLCLVRIGHSSCGSETFSASNRWRCWSVTATFDWCRSWPVLGDQSLSYK